MNRFGLKYCIAFDYFGLEVKKTGTDFTEIGLDVGTGSENGYKIVKKGSKVPYFDGCQADLVTSKGFCIS